MVNNFLVKQDFDELAYVALACNTVTNNFFVTWQYDNGADYDIWGQLVDYDGYQVGPGFPVANLSSTDQSFPDVAYDFSSETYLVVFEDSRGDYTEIYGQMMVEAGGMITPTITATDTNFIISDDLLEGGKGVPSTAYDSFTGKFITVWEDNRNHYEANNGIDIYNFKISLNE